MNLHYNIPTFRDRNENIQLTKFGVNQPLLVMDDNGQYRIYFVVDNTITNETVDNAITNEHIISLESLIAGGSSSYTEVTFDEIKNLVDNNQIVPGNWYLITDVTHRNKLYDGTIYEGNVVPILTHGITTNAVSEQCYDLDHPDEIIYYKLYSNSDFPKGKVYKRQNPSQNIDICFDYRQETNQRYQGNFKRADSDPDENYYFLHFHADSTNRYGYRADGSDYSVPATSSAVLRRSISDSIINSSNFHDITITSIYDIEIPLNLYFQNFLSKSTLENVMHSSFGGVQSSTLKSCSGLVAIWGINSSDFFSVNRTVLWNTDRCEIKGIFRGNITNQYIKRTKITFGGSTTISNPVNGNNNQSFINVDIKVYDRGNDFRLLGDSYTNTNIQFNKISDHCYFNGNFDGTDLIVHEEIDGVDFNGNINGSDIKVSSLDGSVFQEISDSRLRGRWENVTASNIVNSEIVANLDDSDTYVFTDINGSILTINSNYVLEPISLTYGLDTTGGGFTVELPENPFDGQLVSFIDKTGSTAANNVTIVVSQSATPPPNNTINGGTSLVIDDDYAFVQLKYVVGSGWLILTNTIVVPADGITLEKTTNYHIKNIDYIIDNDGESIDGSDTPMSDPHTELVTRAFVESLINGAVQVTPLTYNEFMTLYNGSNLEPLAYYRITDYTHTNYIDPSESNTYSVVNPIIVQAIDVNQISATAYDTNYPQDIITWNPTDNTAPHTTGRIVYRKDLDRNIEGDYDWRLTRYERWMALFTEFDYNTPEMQDVPVMPQSDSIVQFASDLSSYGRNLNAGSSVGLKPVISDDANLENVKLTNCPYTVIDFGNNTQRFYNITLTDVEKSTLYLADDNSTARIYNVNINKAEYFFTKYSLMNVDIHGGSYNPTYNVAFMGTTQNVKVTNQIQRLLTPTAVGNVYINGKWSGGVNGRIIQNVNVTVSNYFSISSQSTINGISGQADTINLRAVNDPNGLLRNVSINSSGTVSIVSDHNINGVSVYGPYLEGAGFDNIENTTIFKGMRSPHFANVTNSTIYDELPYIYGVTWDETGFDIDKNVVSTTDADNGKACLDISITYLIDTTDANYSLMLPPNPREGQTILFMDKANNCGNAPFRIEANTSGNGIQTINGRDFWKIDKNYGFLKLVYNSDSGWLVVEETIIQSEVDDITIAENPGYVEDVYTPVTGADITEWMQNAWGIPADPGDWSVKWDNYDGNSIINGSYSSDDEESYISISNDNDKPQTWNGGTYYFYLDVQIDDVDGGIAQLVSDNGGSIGGEQVYDAVYDGTVDVNGNTYYKYHWEVDPGESDTHRTMVYIYIHPGDSFTGDFTMRGFTYDVIYHGPEHTIKNIDYIIDDDGESIDGSDTPMSDAHKELVTRAYVEDYVGSLAYWQKDASPTGYGQQLHPTDADVKRISVINSDRGFNDIYLENSNTSDNYTGVSIVMTVDSTNYTNQTFISHHGPNYYQPHLRSRGAIMTDSSMYIGAYNSTDRQGEPSFVAFIVGDDYYNQKEIFRLTTNGLEMPLTDKKIWYQAGTVLQNHPANFTQLFTNADTSEVYAATPMNIAPVRVVESSDNIDLASGVANIDGTVLADGDRVLLTAQTDGTENGIYIVDNTNGWSRSSDLPNGTQVAGKTVVVKEGSTYADSLWIFTNDDGSDVVGTDTLTFKVLSNPSVTVTKITERHIITSTDVSNGYYDLANTPLVSEHLFVYYNGVLLDEDTNGDFTINGNRITFTADFVNNVLESGDKLIVKYSY